MRLAAFGFLFGLSVGYILVIIFPQLSVNTVSFIQQENQMLGYDPNYYSIKGGSVAAAATAQLPYLLGFIGFFVGLAIHLVLRKFRSPKSAV